MLNDVDKLGSDVQTYVSNLSYILGKNIWNLQALQRKVESFDKHLKDEAELSMNYWNEKNKFD